MNRTTRMVAALAAAVVVMALAGACSGSDSESALDVSSVAGDGEAVEEPSGERRAGEPGSSADTAGRTLVSIRSVIRTGEVALTSDDLAAARDGLDALLERLGGTVDNEQAEHDEDGRIERSTVVVRVPVASFGDAMAAVQDLGTVKHADTTSKDVTTQVIDVDERVETLENSLDRLQAYQQDAADIDDLIRFEQQITQREAELQSLQAQQAHLADQTSMSTITVHLSTPRKYVAPPGALDEAGFLTGLSAGWGALVNTAVVLLTVLGAALPFLVVLALLGAPIGLLLRRLVRRDRVVPEPAPPAD